MKPDPASPTRQKILFYLKTRGSQTAGELAARLDLTAMAVRQHLYALERGAEVDHHDERRPVGRPARYWQVTAAAAARFPDSHAELTTGLIDAARAAFGEAGLGQLIAARSAAQLAAYRDELPPDAPLAGRVAALAAVRSREGYMAEWSEDEDGTLWLIENHCPICVAARGCQGLCHAEQTVFEEALGPGAAVERTEHILSDDRRCAYRITPRP